MIWVIVVIALPFVMLGMAYVNDLFLDAAYKDWVRRGSPTRENDRRED